MMKFSIKTFSLKGAGVARFKGKKVYIWGALPGEEVEVRIVKRKRSYFEAVVERVLKSSSFRIHPKEDHFLSCSPWQILPYEKEIELKKQLATSFVKEKLGVEFGEVEIVFPKEPFHYRTKMEYQFSTKGGKLALAYGRRGSKEKTPISPCLLAREEINRAAEEILKFLQEKGFNELMLKTLVLRTGQDKEVSAALFTYLSKESFQNRFPDFKEQLPLKGFAIYYSTPLSPASVITDVIYKRGEFDFTWQLLGKVFKYGFSSFFQINPEIFEKALKDIVEEVEGGKVVDYYSGVGVIGILASQKASEVVLVEIDEEAVNFAKENVKINQASNVEIILSAAESALQFIEKDFTVILDPARSGLHKRVVKRLKLVKPKKIIYLSCNLETQVRDVAYLLPFYKITNFKLYNFFPRTPHVESLMVLELTG